MSVLTDAAFTSAIEQGYLVTRREAVRNAYYVWCRANHKPFVVLKPGPKRFGLTLDLASAYPIILTDAAEKTLVAALHPAMTRDSYMGYGPSYVGASHLSNQHRESVVTACLAAIASLPAWSEEAARRLWD